MLLISLGFAHESLRNQCIWLNCDTATLYEFNTIKSNNQDLFNVQGFQMWYLLRGNISKVNYETKALTQEITLK